jgi:hypothetical protein
MVDAQAEPLLGWSRVKRAAERSRTRLRAQLIIPPNYRAGAATGCLSMPRSVPGRRCRVKGHVQRTGPPRGEVSAGPRTISLDACLFPTGS